MKLRDVLIRPGHTLSCLVLVTTLMFARAEPVAAQEPPRGYDLQQCLHMALENSSRLRASRETQNASKAQIDQARARRWPTLSVGAQAAYQSEVNQIDLAAPISQSIRFGDYDSYGLVAGVDVPLYTGGTLAASERAQRAAAHASDFDEAADSLLVVRDVRLSFFAALGAQAEVDAADLAVNRLQRHLEQLHGQVRAGAASTEAQLQVESRLRSAEQRLLSAKEERTVRRLQLGRALGQPELPVTPEGKLDQSLLAGGPVPEGAVGAASQDSAFTEPPSSEVSARPELHAVTYRQRATEAQKSAAKGSLLPSIVANLQMHYAKPGVRVVDNEWMDWASAGVQLRWTLFDAGGRSARVREFEATSRALAYQHEELERSLTNQLRVSQARVVAQRKQISKALQRVELERQRLRLVEGRYQQGLGTETELLDAQDDLSDAEVAVAAQRAQLRLAEVKLLYAVAR
jgi:outer membrane protein TolC